MQVNLGILDKLTKLILVLMVLAALGAVGVWYLPVIKRNEKMRRDILSIEKEIAKEEALNRKLREAIEAATRDPRTIERLARERLGFARKGETIVRFEPPPTAPSRLPAP